MYLGLSFCIGVCSMLNFAARYVGNCCVALLQRGIQLVEDLSLVDGAI